MTISPIIMSLNVRHDSPPERLAWAVENGFALEYTPCLEHLSTLETSLSPYVNRGTLIRFHAFLSGYELGMKYQGKTSPALKAHLEVLKAIRGIGQPVMTVHIQLDPSICIDEKQAAFELSKLVESAEGMGITITLENLRRGYTSHPENVLALSEASGANITLDIGHAISCQRVRNGKLTPHDFIAAFRNRLCEVHIYGYEDDRHYPIKDWAGMKPIIADLLNTRCYWWTIELENLDEALATRENLHGLIEQCLLEKSMAKEG